ncbi:MAG: hypothetical protein JW929_15190 [Anaerolineales bacterium]|nr:hypothetical protein [Anaerolineales bacterium]
MIQTALFFPFIVWGLKIIAVSANVILIVVGVSVVSAMREVIPSEVAFTLGRDGVYWLLINQGFAFLSVVFALFMHSIAVFILTRMRQKPNARC